MPPPLDGVIKVNGPEVRRRGQQHHVHLVGHFPVAVETGEAAILAHFQLVRHLGLGRKVSQAALDLVAESIGHGVQLEVLVRLEGLGGRSRAPPTTADQPDPERAASCVLGGMGCQGRRGGGDRSLLHELSTVGFLHFISFEGEMMKLRK